ncbi:MAG: sigma 54-interacting transcriptional regulator [Pseudomonadota bacterium]
MTKQPKTILLADDDASILMVLTRAMKAQGYTVMASEHISDVDGWVRAGLGDAVVTDVTMPRGNGLDGLARWQALRPELPVIVMSAHNTLLNAAKAQDLGAVTFLPKPFDLNELMEALEKACRHQSPAANKDAEDGIVRISDELVLIGKSPAMQQVFGTLAKLIGNDLTVLIAGESGTGKERIARALHELSRRKAHPFVALNMAAIPRELIESALFGHEKGAFTGAHSKQTGAFEQAHGGTLFLDEIGDMPMEAQTRLLRVLQEQQVTPIGATKAVKTQVRIIAATHRDLTALVANGQFREDLYFRLHVVPLALPPLRDHPEDIAALVTHFMTLAQARGLAPKTLDAAALTLLGQHDWPGNVRELEHLIYRLCALTQRSSITARDIAPLLSATSPRGEAKTRPAITLHSNSQESIPTCIESFMATQLSAYFAAHEDGLPAPGLYDRLMIRIERPLIVTTLRATGGNQIKAAEILGLNRNTLRKKMRELGIDAKSLMLKDAA